MIRLAELLGNGNFPRRLLEFITRGVLARLDFRLSPHRESDSDRLRLGAAVVDFGDEHVGVRCREATNRQIAALDGVFSAIERQPLLEPVLPTENGAANVDAHLGATPAMIGRAVAGSLVIAIHRKNVIAIDLHADSIGFGPDHRAHAAIADGMPFDGLRSRAQVDQIGRRDQSAGIDIEQGTCFSRAAAGLQERRSDDRAEAAEESAAWYILSGLFDGHTFSRFLH